MYRLFTLYIRFYRLCTLYVLFITAYLQQFTTMLAVRRPLHVLPLTLVENL